MKYELMIDNKFIKISEVKLYDIDKYSTNFNNIKELLTDLSKRINEKLPNFAIVKIGYRVGNDLYAIDVAYSDKDKLKDIDFEPKNSYKKTTKINHNNKVFKNTIQKFIKLAKDDRYFYNHIIKSTDFSLKIKEILEEIVIRKNDSIFNRNRLDKYLDSYLQFRILLFAMDAYEQNKLANKEQTYQPKRKIQEEYNKTSIYPNIESTINSKINRNYSYYIDELEPKADDYSIEETDYEDEENKYR